MLVSLVIYICIIRIKHVPTYLFKKCIHFRDFPSVIFSLKILFSLIDNNFPLNILENKIKQNIQTGLTLNTQLKI